MIVERTVLLDLKLEDRACDLSGHELDELVKLLPLKCEPLISVPDSWMEVERARPLPPHVRREWKVRVHSPEGKYSHDYLPVSSWEGLLRSVRGFYAHLRAGRLTPGCTASVVTRLVSDWSPR